MLMSLVGQMKIIRDIRFLKFKLRCNSKEDVSVSNKTENHNKFMFLTLNKILSMKMLIRICCINKNNNRKNIFLTLKISDITKVLTFVEL